MLSIYFKITKILLKQVIQHITPKLVEEKKIEWEKKKEMQYNKTKTISFGYDRRREKETNIPGQID